MERILILSFSEILFQNISIKLYAIDKS